MSAEQVAARLQAADSQVIRVLCYPQNPPLRLVSLPLAILNQEVANSLQLSLVDLNSHVISVESCKRQTEAENAQLQRELEKLRFELDNSVEDADNLQMQNNNLLSREEELIAANELNAAAIKSLEAQVHATVFMSVYLSLKALPFIFLHGTQLAEVRDKAGRDEDSRFESLQEQLCSERSSHASAKSTLATTLTAYEAAVLEIAALTEQSAFNSDTILSLQNAVQELRAQAKLNNSSLEDMNRNLDDRMKEIIELVGSNDSLKEDLAAVKEEKSTMVSYASTSPSHIQPSTKLSLLRRSATNSF